MPLSLSAYHDYSWVVVTLKHTCYSNQHYVGHIEVHRFQLISCSCFYKQSGFSYQFSSFLIDRETNYLKALKKIPQFKKKLAGGDSFAFLALLYSGSLQWLFEGNYCEEEVENLEFSITADSDQTYSSTYCIVVVLEYCLATVGLS